MQSIEFQKIIFSNYTWSSVSAGKWETQIPALLEIRTIGIIL